MKKQKTTKVKLTFAKQTIVKLDKDAMMRLQAGYGAFAVSNQAVCGSTGATACNTVLETFTGTK